MLWWSNHKIISLLLRNCHFPAVMNFNISSMQNIGHVTPGGVMTQALRTQWGATHTLRTAATFFLSCHAFLSSFVLQRQPGEPWKHTSPHVPTVLLKTTLQLLPISMKTNPYQAPPGPTWADVEWAVTTKNTSIGSFAHSAWGWDSV